MSNFQSGRFNYQIVRYECTNALFKKGYTDIATATPRERKFPDEVFTTQDQDGRNASNIALNKGFTDIAALHIHREKISGGSIHSDR